MRQQESTTLRSSGWRPACLTLAAALLLGIATTARADSDFENGFEDQMGRILAFEAVQAGKALLFPYAQPAYYAQPAVYYRPPVVHYAPPVVHHVPVVVPGPYYRPSYGLRDHHRHAYQRVKHHRHHQRHRHGDGCGY